MITVARASHVRPRARALVVSRAGARKPSPTCRSEAHGDEHRLALFDTILIEEALASLTADPPRRHRQAPTTAG